MAHWHREEDMLSCSEGVIDGPWIWWTKTWLEMQEKSIWLSVQLSQRKQRTDSLQLPFIRI